MKTLKILAALIFVLSFTFNRVNAQVVRDIYDQYWYIYIPCIDETVSGILTLTHLSWPDRDVVKAEGILTGSNEIEYSINWHWNYVWPSPKLDNEFINNWHENQIIRVDHNMIALVHVNFLWYYDENGEKTFIVDNWKVMCK